MANETDPWWIGQRRINGKLCQVDWRIVEALREVSRLLASSSADVSQLNEMISQADRLSAEVALERPPGCDPEDRTGTH